MSQWGRPRHSGTRHNRRVRGRGTWSAQDRRLSRHQLGRLHRKKGRGDTWTGQVRRLERPRDSRGRRLALAILILGAAVIALTAGGRVIAVLVVTALLVLAWRYVRRPRRH